MKARVNPLAAAPGTFDAVRQLDTFVRGTGLDPKLLHLLKVRASQINRCAFCIDMHVKEALDDGEDPQRLHLLAAWRESPLYTERERAVLAWTESLTLLADRGAPDAEWEALKKHFPEADAINLTAAIAMINFWNRWTVAFGSQHPVGMDKRLR